MQRLAELETVARAPWRSYDADAATELSRLANSSPTMFETENGYILCADHAKAWREGGNDVTMHEIVTDLACADCEDEAEMCDPRPIDIDVCVDCVSYLANGEVFDAEPIKDRRHPVWVSACRHCGWPIVPDADNGWTHTNGIVGCGFPRQGSGKDGNPLGDIEMYAEPERRKPRGVFSTHH